jgi:hypothetical protein
MNAHGRKSVARACALAFFALGTFSGTSHAQIAALGATTEVLQFFVRGVDAAHDPRTNSYLMVGGQNVIVGVCVGADGKPIAAPFTIKPGGSPAGSFPRAAYSPDLAAGAGGFLVVWSGEVENVTVQLHSRVVTCGGPVAPDQNVSAPWTSWIDVDASAVAYSATSKQFLAVWKTMDGIILARLVGLSGEPIGNPVQLSAGYCEKPGVAWNPNTNEFGVSFVGESRNGSGDKTSVFSAFVKVPASNLAAFSRTTFNALPAQMLEGTSNVVFNTATNRYLMSWFEISSGFYAKVAEFDANGNLVAQNVASGRIGSYDALSLAFNPISNTSLLVGVDRANDTVLAAELNGSGIRTSPELTISSSAPPARYTRVASSTTTATWNANWSARGFNAIASQIVGTGSAGGGPLPPPPGPTSAPRLAIDTPRTNLSVAAEGFAIGGWAADLGAPAGSGVDAVHVWAFPAAGGAPVFLGAAQYGISRPDVGAYAGSARFNTSGFSLTGVLGAAGVYDIHVFARSTVTGTFNNEQIVRITVQPPVSIPRMSVDFPTPDLTLSMNVSVSGWAADLAGGGGSGVDAVHVYAYPIAGGAPIFVGAAAYGFARPDVAGVFGSGRLMSSGFVLQATVPRGDYNLVVFARSSITHTFNNVSVVRIRVV